MVDDMLLSPADIPLDIIPKHGRFNLRDYYGAGEDLIAPIISGKLVRIYHGAWRGFPYNTIELRDATNTLRLHISRNLASYKEIVLTLHGLEDSQLRGEITLTVVPRGGRDNCIVLLDRHGKEIGRKGGYHVPSIHRWRESKDEPYRNDHSAKLAYLDGLAEDINARISAI